MNNAFNLEITGVQHGAASASIMSFALGSTVDVYKQGCERIVAMPLLHPGSLRGHRLVNGRPRLETPGSRAASDRGGDERCCTKGRP